MRALCDMAPWGSSGSVFYLSSEIAVVHISSNYNTHVILIIRKPSENVHRYDSSMMSLNPDHSKALGTKKTTER